MNKKIIWIPLAVGGTILLIAMVKAKPPTPPEELEIPEYPVERVVFIENTLNETMAEQSRIPQAELNWMING